MAETSSAPIAQVLAHTVQGIQGDVRPALTVQAGNTQFTIILTELEAVKLADILPEGLRGAARHAAKVNSETLDGLVVPTTGDIRRITKGKPR